MANGDFVKYQKFFGKVLVLVLVASFWSISPVRSGEDDDRKSAVFSRLLCRKNLALIGATAAIAGAGVWLGSTVFSEDGPGTPDESELSSTGIDFYILKHTPLLGDRFSWVAAASDVSPYVNANRTFEKIMEGIRATNHLRINHLIDAVKRLQSHNVKVVLSNTFPEDHKQAYFVNDSENPYILIYGTPEPNDLNSALARGHAGVTDLAHEMTHMVQFLASGSRPKGFVHDREKRKSPYDYESDPASAFGEGLANAMSFSTHGLLLHPFYQYVDFADGGLPAWRKKPIQKKLANESATTTALMMLAKTVNTGPDGTRYLITDDQMFERYLETLIKAKKRHGDILEFFRDHIAFHPQDRERVNKIAEEVFRVNLSE